jgi:hypothetical protein
MPDHAELPGSAATRRMILRMDRMALAGIVRQHRTCEATGERLDVGNAVAMTVAVRPGVSRLAVVSAAHWDNGTGALSSADPGVHPDVLDGRQLFAPIGAATRSGAGRQSPERPARGAEPIRLQRPQVPEGARVVPRL